MAMAKKTQALSQELGLTNKHIFFAEDWVPYEERANFLLDAACSFCALTNRNALRFSHPYTRLLLGGLPI